MTIRFLRDYQGHSSGSEISTWSTRQEDLAIAAGAATRTLGTQQVSVYPSANAAGVKPAEGSPVTLNAAGTSLVSGDEKWLIPGANAFTASDAGSDWYRAPDVLQIAAVLGSGTSTTVLVEVRTAAGVVSTAMTITADTVAQVLRSSILTREMHEFRIRRSSGTGTVTVTV